MELAKKLEKQHKLLERIRQELSDSGLPCRIDAEDIPGTDQKIEICRLLTDDLELEEDPLMAEFFFLNTELSAPDLIYFTAMISLREDIKLAQSMQLIELLTMINQNLPFGAFKLDMNSGLLSYRMDAIYNALCDDEAIYPHLTATAANMLNASHSFSPIIVEVADGRASSYEAMSAFHLGSFAEE